MKKKSNIINEQVKTLSKQKTLVECNMENALTTMINTAVETVGHLKLPPLAP